MPTRGEGSSNSSSSRTTQRAASNLLADADDERYFQAFDHDDDGTEGGGTELCEVADADLDADVESFEPFEPGNPWSQKIPTQVQRKNWRKVVYMEQTSSPPPQEPSSVSASMAGQLRKGGGKGGRRSSEGLGIHPQHNHHPSSPSSTTSSSSSTRVASSPATRSRRIVKEVVEMKEGNYDDDDYIIDIIDIDDDDDADEIENRAPLIEIPDQQQERGRSKEVSKPWWSDGKTAPLLEKFDGDRRSFYLAQAGVRESSSAAGDDHEPGLHSYQGRRQPPVILPSSSNITTSSTSATFTLPNHHHHQDPSPNSNNNNITLQRKALSLSLAGNANSPMADRRMTIATTPRKKTWDATWGKDGQRNGAGESTTPPTSNKKSKMTPHSGPSSAMQQRLIGGSKTNGGSLGARKVAPRKTT